MRCLTAIPVYNEAKHVCDVLCEVRKHSADILVVDDGSTDGTSKLLDAHKDIHRVNHPKNMGYGAALKSAFDYAIDHKYDVLVTMDCDGQHEPSRIPLLLESLGDADILSGSRYLRDFRQNTYVPEERLRINRMITEELNKRYGLELTDAFCGFKAYRSCALSKLSITERGWGMPLQLWVQAVRLGLKVREIGVPRIYLDPERAFGGLLNDPEERFAYYLRILDETERSFPPSANPCQELYS